MVADREYFGKSVARSYDDQSQTTRLHTISFDHSRHCLPSDYRHPNRLFIPALLVKLVGNQPPLMCTPYLSLFSIIYSYP